MNTERESYWERRETDIASGERDLDGERKSAKRCAILR